MEITQSTAYKIMFLLVDETDDETPETGKSPTVTISKNGGAFASTTNSAAELSGGWYAVTLTTTETNTLGELVVEASDTGTDVYRTIYQVLAAPSTSIIITQAQHDAIADNVLRRLASNVEASSDGDTPGQKSLLGVILKITGRTRIAAAKMETYKNDETTLFFDQNVTTDPAADPISEVV